MPEDEHYPRYLYSYDNQRRRKKRRKILLRRLIALAGFVAFIIATVFVVKAIAFRNAPVTVSSESTTTTEAVLSMKVAPVASTTPAAFHMATQIYRGNTLLPSYSRPEAISFGPGKYYTDLPGVITFRGNNYRDGGSYGTVKVVDEDLKMLWQVTTGHVDRSTGGVWTGSGWTGQPLIVKWPDAVKQKMNLYVSKKADPDLVEVIYPCLDGKIYFLDLRDGSATRPAINTGGGAIKGTASIYPSGIPLLFVGPGDALPASKPEGAVKFRVYSLVDEKLLYTFGHNDPEAYRTLWEAYDSSALIDAKTDTLIEPGENGVLYTIKLNTKWDPATGKLSINPDEAIKYRYTAPDYADGPDPVTNQPDNSPTTRWYGMEDSVAAWHGYLYVSDNGGKLMCIDLNTMKLVWVQNVLDDTNCSPVFEESIEDGTAYIYISTSLHITQNGEAMSGNIPIWKINAATGEKVWTSKEYPCVSRSGVHGGVQGTGLLGRGDISNLVVFPIASSPSIAPGLLVALDKKTGQEVWRFAMANYAWSSPVAVYTEGGRSYIIICDTAGMVFLLEGATGNVVASLNTTTQSSAIEATPAAYGNVVVVGTKGKRIDAIQIK
jgi:outer membrane protein assembly factor BamB